MAAEESVLAVVSRVIDVRPSRSQITDARERALILAALHDAFGSTTMAAQRCEGWMPAPQPVSMDRQALKTLRRARADYLCTLKADGSRYVLVMLEIGEDSLAVMVSRTLEMYEVPLVAQPRHFAAGTDAVGAALAGTVLDGELVVRDAGMRYMVFDALVICGQQLRTHELTARMTAVYRHFEVYNMPTGASTQEIEAEVEQSDKVIPLPADTPLQIQAKRWWVVGDLDRMWAGRAALGSPVDGVVFMRRVGVCPGTDRTMFKWKASHTVDICLGAEGQALVAVDGQLRDAASALAEHAGRRKRARCAPVSVELNPLAEVLMSNARDGVSPVVECEIRLENDRVVLVPTKERSDKACPNDVSTVALTIAAASDSIALTTLKGACDGEDPSMMRGQMVHG